MGRDITEYVCYGALLPDVEEDEPGTRYSRRKPLMDALDDDYDTLSQLGLEVVAYSDGPFNVLAHKDSVQRCEERFDQGRVAPLLKMKFPDDPSVVAQWDAQIREYLKGFTRMMMHVGPGLSEDRLKAINELATPEIGWWAGFEDSY